MSDLASTLSVGAGDAAGAQSATASPQDMRMG